MRIGETSIREDVDILKSFGLNDHVALDVVFAAAARAFLTTLIESLVSRAERPWVNDLERGLDGYLDSIVDKALSEGAGPG